MIFCLISYKDLTEILLSRYIVFHLLGKLVSVYVIKHVLAQLVHTRFPFYSLPFSLVKDHVQIIPYHNRFQCEYHIKRKT